MPPDQRCWLYDEQCARQLRFPHLHARKQQGQSVTVSELRTLRQSATSNKHLLAEGMDLAFPTLPDEAQHRRAARTRQKWSQMPKHSERIEP